MKRLLVVVVMIIVPLVLPAQTTQFKTNQNGEFASLSETVDINNSFSLQVSRNTTNTGTTASLSYISFSLASDGLSFTFTQIAGAIPAADFTGQNTQSLTVNFNTDDLDASAVNQSCTIDLTTFDITCGPAPSGTINLQFAENGMQRTRILALGEEIIVGPMTTRIHQRSDNATANASGTIFGISVSTPTAQVGINHNSTIEILHN